NFGSIPSFPESLHKGSYPFLNYSLELVRINRLSLLFGYVYCAAAFCMNLYALGSKNPWEHAAAMVYVGSSLGAVFSGDLLTLFFCLEIMSVAPFFLILFRGTRKAMGAGIRYLLWHHFSGICILTGILSHVHLTGSIEFSHMPWGWGGRDFGYNLMLLGFLVNAASVPFHSWLADSYSEAGPGGSIYLTAYTTKTAVFCLWILFSGVELLIWAGVVSALVSVFLAVLENDGRRLLSYHIVSQVGYMVAGIGMGTHLSLNGAASHAFCHILYKALLYMGAGCPLVVVGTVKFHQLGGLYKYMPYSFWLTMIGGFSISAFPLFSGFVSKTMTLEAAELLHQPVVYLILEGASIGTFLHTGLKLPWNIWLQGKDEPAPEIRAHLKDSALNTPIHMLLGMGILAFLCIFLGVAPGYLYEMLPYPVEFIPFTRTRIFSTIQMFIFSFLGFWFLRKMVKGHPTYTLDTDWLVRIPGSLLIQFCRKSLTRLGSSIDQGVAFVALSAIAMLRNPKIELALNPRGIGIGMLASLLLLAMFILYHV
ncbi:MAG: proton-conducting transporter membrane subunit, partial [Thermodesulfobacteriota bacterium]